jgi:hypothetical protein
MKQNSNGWVDKRMLTSFYLQGIFICMSATQPRENRYQG